MTGLKKTGLDAARHRHGCAIGNRRQERQNRLRITDGIQRQVRIRPLPSFACMPFGLGQGIFLLDLGGIQKNDLHDLGGRRGAIYFTPESFANQLRQKPAMVQMGMGKQNGLDTRGGNRECRPVPIPERPFLVEPAIHQHGGIIHVHSIG